MKISAYDERILWKMYIWSGVRALTELEDSDGVVILRTERDNEYRFPVYLNASSDWISHVLDTLRKAEDVQVRYLTLMWKNHWLDMPPNAMVKGLIKLASENMNAKVLLIGEENFNIKAFSDF